MLDQVCYGAMILLMIVIVMFLYRVIQGPTLFDRLIGLSGISTKAILLLIFIGTYQHNLDMFVDIAIGYGLINLIGSLAAGKYLEERGAES